MTRVTLVVTAALTFGVLSLALPRVAGAPGSTTRSTGMAALSDSDNSNLRRGRSAYERGDFAAAQRDLRSALAELEDVRARRLAQTLLAASAFRSGDFRTTIATLEGRDRTNEDRQDLLLLASAYVESGAFERGMTLFSTLRDRFPDDPEPERWMARYQQRAVGQR